MSTPIPTNNIYSTVAFPDTVPCNVNPYTYPTINVELPRNYVPIRPNHVEFRVEEAVASISNNESVAWAYSFIYYLYFIAINLIHLAVVVAGILVSANVFTQDVDKWITIGIAIATAISLCLTDLMNGLEIQPKKAAFNGTVYIQPKWRRFFF